jgi:hypothetical protein
VGDSAMSMARTNRKMIDKLRAEGSLEAVRAALDRGEITRRQAETLVKNISAARRIQRSYWYSAVMRNATGQYVGEVTSRNGGATWIGRRYGRNYPHDAAEFAREEDAIRFVLAAEATRIGPDAAIQETHAAVRIVSLVSRDALPAPPDLRTNIEAAWNEIENGAESDFDPEDVKRCGRERLDRLRVGR